MHIHESEARVLEIESQSNGAFVACHAWESCFDFMFFNAVDFVFMFFFYKHDDILANHDFLQNWNVSCSTGCVLIQTVGDDFHPKSCPLRVFASYNFFGFELDHFLESHYVNVWILVHLSLQHVGDIPFAVRRWMASAAPRNDGDFDILLLGILILMSAYFHVQGVSDSIWFLQTWMLSS